MSRGIMRIVARNKKARRDYEILDRFEAGIVLIGSEVKSLRAGKASLNESYARIKNGELWLYEMHISPYDNSSVFTPAPKRRRKLLLHKFEILRLKSKAEEKGLTIIPLEIYFNDKGLVKVTIAIARGRREYQKKRYLILKQMDREKERELRDYNRKKRY